MAGVEGVLTSFEESSKQTKVILVKTRFDISYQKGQIKESRNRKVVKETDIGLNSKNRSDAR